MKKIILGILVCILMIPITADAFDFAKVLTLQVVDENGDPLDTTRIEASISGPDVYFRSYYEFEGTTFSFLDSNDGEFTFNFYHKDHENYTLADPFKYTAKGNHFYYMDGTEITSNDVLVLKIPEPENKPVLSLRIARGDLKDEEIFISSQPEVDYVLEGEYIHIYTAYDGLFSMVVSSLRDDGKALTNPIRYRIVDGKAYRPLPNYYELQSLREYYSDFHPIESTIEITKENGKPYTHDTVTLMRKNATLEGYNSIYQVIYELPVIDQKYVYFNTLEEGDYKIRVYYDEDKPDDRYDYVEYNFSKRNWDDIPFTHLNVAIPEPQHIVTYYEQDEHGHIKKKVPGTINIYFNSGTFQNYIVDDSNVNMAFLPDGHYRLVTDPDPYGNPNHDDAEYRFFISDDQVTGEQTVPLVFSRSNQLDNHYLYAFNESADHIENTYIGIKDIEDDGPITIYKMDGQYFDFDSLDLDEFYVSAFTYEEGWLQSEWLEVNEKHNSIDDFMLSYNNAEYDDYYAIMKPTKNIVSDKGRDISTTTTKIINKTGEALWFDEGPLESYFIDLAEEEDAFKRIANLMYEYDIFTGDANKNFNPNERLTRETLMVILVKMYGFKDEALNGQYDSLFEDVPQDHWSTAFLNYAGSTGMTSGLGNGQFGFGDPITDIQLITLLVKRLVEEGKVNLEDYRLDSDDYWSDVYVRASYLDPEYSFISKDSGRYLLHSNKATGLSRKELALILHDYKSITDETYNQ